MVLLLDCEIIVIFYHHQIVILGCDRARHPLWLAAIYGEMSDAFALHD